jgi:15-cis-phytoene synthase
VKDLDLALSYVPRPQRFHLADLFALDAALGNVVRTTREPMVGRIRLAWWRERLQELDRGIVPAEPTLQAAATLISKSSLTGSMLSELVDGWEFLLADFPWPGDTIDAVAEHGATLFALAATAVGAEADDQARTAGSLWILVDVAKHCSDAQSRSRLIESARGRLDDFRGTSQASLRPLTMLGLLAKRDLERWPEIEPEATPGRAWAMIRHKLTGHL